MSYLEGLPARLRAARVAAGMSQDDLARAVCAIAGVSSLTRHEISRYERGKRTPQVWLPAIAEALGIEVADLENAADQARTRPEDDSIALLRRFYSAQAVDPGLAALFARETDAIRVIDRRLGVVAARRKLHAHIEQVGDTLRYSIREQVRSALAETLSDACTLAGWQAIDAGALDTAWTHFEHAKVAAREADDPARLAHAKGEQAYVLSDLQRSGDALELVTSAYADRVPVRLRIWLLMARAEIAACAANERNCRDALADVDTLVAHAEDDPALPFLFVEPHHLSRWRANCLIRFEDQEAVEALHTALNGLQPGTFNRAEAGLRCDMATALLAQGERDEAQQQADRAADLADLTGSVRQRRRIATLRTHLAAIDS